MYNQNDLYDELSSQDSNFPSGTGTPFSVPADFFEGFADVVMAKIKGTTVSAAEETAAISPLLAGLSRAMPFFLQEDYFKSTITELPFLINEPESPVLSSVNRAVPFDVPAEYFSGLPHRMVERVSVARPSSLYVAGKKWMRIAVAAIIAGIIVLAGFLYTSLRSTALDSTQPIASQLTNVSTKELDDFIATTDISITNGADQSKPANAEVGVFLKDISDHELDAFLSQIPTEEDLSEIN